MLDAAQPIFEFLYAFISENFDLREIEDNELIFFSGSPTDRENKDAVIAQNRADEQTDRDADNYGKTVEAGGGKRPFLKDRFFGRFDRGLSLGEVGNFPAVGCLEFGQMTDIVPDRSPEGYSYELSYDLLILTRTGPAKNVREVFRSDSGSARGSGDIIIAIIQKAWDQLHTGMLSRGNYEIKAGEFRDKYSGYVSGGFGQLPVSDNNWWVKEWTCNVNGEVVDTTKEFRDVYHNLPDASKKVIVFKFTVFEQLALD